MLINYNPDETNTVQDVNERKDVRIETTIETSPARIQIADRQFDFVNIRALFENNSSIVRNNSNILVVKQEQIAETVIEQNEIKQNNARILKTETTIKKQKNKDAKKDHTNDSHHQKTVIMHKDGQTISDNHHKEAVINKKDEQTINDSHHQKTVINNKDKQTIKDNHHKEAVFNNKDKQTIKDLKNDSHHQDSHY
ncbi:hypothetical protein NBO_7g0022 [Nosema bombycis CQ1]|uniref:Uncharacterized protein n=1 Tax=Nosema bombycis (strain CQ1 / CVCC 102059) TaxID=578461 RepID=R0MB53_NOSB1|nr:hypothetical protein NBO_7g0022 [Nosema bombycis CQ1]|eukprot:EOB15204.1 hypothetical protein NBO_7g0022 [Nosema bombycis CQ1]